MNSSQLAKEPMVMRPRILTNLAAEFTETRAGKAVIACIVSDDEGRIPETVEFQPELDRFIPQDQIGDEAEYYKSSLEMVNQIEDVLTTFRNTLIFRKLDRTLGIEIKELRDYGIEDVLDIAQRLENKNEDPSTGGCLRAIRKCFQAVGRHGSPMSSLLEFVPKDIYGSILCGGFSLILAAAMKYEKHRKEIHTSLSDIPQKLKRVCRLQEAHIHSRDLKICAASVFLSIFKVMELIVDKLSMTFGQSALSRIKGRSGDIGYALEDLDASIDAFQAEIEICMQLRMGRMEENSNYTKNVVTDMKASYDRDSKNIERRLQKEQDSHESFISAVFSGMYRVCASSESFNPIDGTLDVQRIIKLVSEDSLSKPQKLLGNTNSAAAFPTGIIDEAINKWVSDMTGDGREPLAAVDECLGTIEDMSLKEKDKIQWLMDSDEIYEWFGQERSCTLAIEAEIAPEDLANAISYASALMTKCLGSATPSSIVLSFFCGLEANESQEEDDSGPLGIMKSLLVQFVKAIQKSRRDIDLSSLCEERSFRKAGKNLKQAMSLFRDLLGLLREKDSVFILIDSFSRMSGDEDLGDKVLGRLLDMIDSHPNITIKILVTDPMPNCPLKGRVDILLHLPEHVDLGRNGINTRLLTKTNCLRIQELQERQDSAELSSDDDSVGSYFG